MARALVEDVWKRFTLKRDRADSIGKMLFRMLPQKRRAVKTEEFWALQGISIEVPEGKSFGIIGNNGSGKSTLLKILTRTMQPTRGRVETHGRISALIELGAGFHPDFTGRENVYLNASILGIRRREIEARMDDIISFAQIEQFIDTPVKYYSSGMHARLGFSVATAVEPELLIVDEVLAVGDEGFQKQCMDRIDAMKREGMSILLVSHDLSSIERLMDEAVWIHRGTMGAIGKPRDVILAYRERVLGEVVSTDMSNTGVLFGGRPEAILRRVLVSYGSGRGSRIAAGEGVTIKLEVETREYWESLHVEISLSREDGLRVAVISTVDDGEWIPFGGTDGVITLELLQVWLVNGIYQLDVIIRSRKGDPLGSWKGVGCLEVKSGNQRCGVLTLPHQWIGARESVQIG